MKIVVALLIVLSMNTVVAMESSNPIITALRKKQSTDEVKKIIDANPKLINTPDLISDNTPLTEAIINQGNTEIVKYLLEKNADVNKESSLNGAPLSIAIHKGSEEIINLLLDKKPTITAQTIYLAAENESMLEKLKSNINIADPNGFTALMLVSGNSQSDESRVKNLLKYGADASRKDKNGRTTLMYAVLGNNKTIVEDILQKAKATINDIANDHTTALILAIARNNKDIVKLLLDNGADPLLANAFVDASEYAEILKVFVDKNIDLNKPLTKDGITALMLAAQNTQEVGPIINLLKSGADASLKDTKGNTALMYALEKRKDFLNPTKTTAQIVEALLKAHNNVNEKNNDGDTALSIAQNYYRDLNPDQQEVLEKIVAAKPDVTYKSGPHESSFKEFIERKQHTPLYAFYKRIYEPDLNALLQGLNVSLTALNNSIEGIS